MWDLTVWLQYFTVEEKITCLSLIWELLLLLASVVNWEASGVQCGSLCAEYGAEPWICTCLTSGMLLEAWAGQGCFDSSLRAHC